MSRAALVAWGGLMLAVGLKAVAVALVLLTPVAIRSEEGLGFVVWTPGVLAFAGVGAVVAARRPENPIGWLFLAVGVVEPIAVFAEAYARFGTIPGATVPMPALVGVLGAAMFTMAIAFMILILLLFPTGELPSPRWRPVLWATVGWLASMPFIVLLAPGPISEMLPIANPIVGPLALREMASMIRPLEELISVPFLLLAAGAVLGRWRGARLRERAQLKWFGSATILIVVAVLAESIVSAFGTPQQTDIIGLVLLVGAVASVPISAGIAILRYRLYDIDLVIRRTLVYGALVAVLGGSYVGLVLAFQSVLGELTRGDTVPVALSTLAIAALFGPVRARVGEIVDRRFYRSRYDARRTVEAFAGQLRDEVELDAVGRTLVDVASRAVQPASASVWLRAGPSR